MGYIRHHAVVVTAFSEEYAIKAAKAATDTNNTVSGPTASPVNGYWTIVIVPDRSKEGWKDSSDGDVYRAAIKCWLRSMGDYYEWVEVAYGHDDGKALITDEA